MRKIIKVTAIVIASLVAVGFLGLTYVIGDQSAKGLMYQNADKDTHYASEWQMDQWGYDWQGFEETYEIHAFTVSGQDGYEIPVKQLGQVTEGHTVILVHGAGGDYASVYPQAEIYIKNGWNVLAMDQRGSGDSKDPRVTFGVLEQEDVARLVAYAKTEYGKKVVVHGCSMGGATVGIYGAKANGEAMADAIIIDSSYDSMENCFRSVWADMDPGLPGSYGVWCGNIFLKTREGFVMADGDVVEAMGQCKLPTMIIQSKQDQLATEAMGEALFNAIPHEQKAYWLVDSDHIEGCVDHPQAYENHVLEFINEVIAVSERSDL